jgi:hypothetical protein
MTRPAPSLPTRRAPTVLAMLLLLALLIPGSARAGEAASQRYIVVFQGDYALDSGYALGDGYALGPVDALGLQYALGPAYALVPDYALDGGYALYALDDAYALGLDYALYALYALDDAYALASAYALANAYALPGGYALPAIYALDESYALAREYALRLVESAGGTVASDLSRQLGVMVVDSKNATFAEVMSGYALVDTVGQNFGWKAFPSFQEAVASGALTVLEATDLAGTGEPLSALQWNMQLIRAPDAHAVTTGSPKVEVGIIDTGIDGTHVDFVGQGGSNVDCARGADFTAEGPGIGIPAACVDNNFHGTHVAGIVAARLNGHGVAGVAPDVTLVPIKVCDADGHCYASDVVEGITYAGDLALDVINMSFFVDDDEFQQSTEFKCNDDPQQRAFRQATERAIAYVRQQGGTPVAALGNSDRDLARKPEGGNCAVVPAETAGVVGTMSLGPESGKAWFSNYGKGAVDVGAPGGDLSLLRDGPTGWCERQVLSTLPGNTWGCFQGTSMASPHAAGVAALIISRFGKADKSGNLSMSPGSVASQLQKTAIDIGLTGYDKCFGHGRIDALRAVNGQTSGLYDPSAPFCPEYDE